MLWCELYGEGSYLTKDCRTIASMRDYMNLEPPRGDCDGEQQPNNEVPATPPRPRIDVWMELTHEESSTRSLGDPCSV